MNTPAPVVPAAAAPPPTVDSDGYKLDANGQRIPGQTPPARQPAAAKPDPKTVPLKETSEITITPAAGASQNAGTDTDVDTKKRERLWDVLTARRAGCPQISADNQKKLSFGDTNLLNSLGCVQNSTGTLSIFNPNGNQPIVDMSPNGAVGIRKNWDLSKPAELTSAGHIDALLKGSELAKMTMGDGGANLAAPNDNSRAMMEKAAMLTHLNIANPTYKTKAELDAALDKIDPGDPKASPPTLPLSQRMEKQWAEMKGEYNKDPEAFVKPDIKQPAAATPAATATPGAAAPGAATPKTATAVTADNIKTLETSGKPVVLMVYDPTHPDSQKQIDQLAAAAGDKVTVMKMDVNQMHDLAAVLPANDPLRQKLEGNSTTPSANLVVLDSKGQMAAAQQGIPPNLQQWVEKDVLKANVFPPPATVSTAPAVAPAPSVAPGS